MRPSRGIDLAQTELPELLAALRMERGWSKADLAEKAGLSIKVVHQIESRSRAVFLEKTLLLVCEALGINLEELLRPSSEPAGDRHGESAESSPHKPSGPAPAFLRSRRSWYFRRPARILAFAVLAALFMAVPLFWGSLRSISAPRVEIVGRAVQVSDPASGKLRWSRTFAATVVHAEPSPWHDGSVVVGLYPNAFDGGRVLLLDGKTGATLWDRAPDVELAIRAFGEEILDGLGSFGPIAYEHIDLDGDGRLDLAVSFMHMRTIPTAL